MNIVFAILFLIGKVVWRFPMFALAVALIGCTFAGWLPWYLWAIPIVGMIAVIGFGQSSMNTWVAPLEEVKHED